MYWVWLLSWVLWLCISQSWQITCKPSPLVLCLCTITVLALLIWIHIWTGITVLFNDAVISCLFFKKILSSKQETSYNNKVLVIDTSMEPSCKHSWMYIILIVILVITQWFHNHHSAVTSQSNDIKVILLMTAYQWKFLILLDHGKISWDSCIYDPM